jgi:hypothetical protein
VNGSLRVSEVLSLDPASHLFGFQGLVYYHEKSVDEVAHMLQIRSATVKTRIFYARKRLADMLK